MLIYEHLRNMRQNKLLVVVETALVEYKILSAFKSTIRVVFTHVVIWHLKPSSSNIDQNDPSKIIWFKYQCESSSLFRNNIKKIQAFQLVISLQYK